MIVPTSAVIVEALYPRQFADKLEHQLHDLYEKGHTVFDVKYSQEKDEDGSVHYSALILIGQKG